MAGKAVAVRKMFAGIAPRYDLLNRILSFNLDQMWRRATVSAVHPSHGERVLDVCAGTLDLSILLVRTGARVIAFDFCREMLLRGRAKATAQGHPMPIVEADAMCPPFLPGSFDVVTVAFGIRNLEDPAAGLRTLAGLLRPGGRIAVLEFSRPDNAVFRFVYHAYFHHVLPRIGRLVSRHASAYSYLPDSVRTVLAPEEMRGILTTAGLNAPPARPLGLGALTLVTAIRPA